MILGTTNTDRRKEFDVLDYAQRMTLEVDMAVLRWQGAE